MADYNLQCINCYHGPHVNGPCTQCLAPNICTQFVRADIFGARQLAMIHQDQQNIGSQTLGALSTIFELLGEAYPEALERLKARAAEQQKLAEEAMEAERAKSLAEAEEAYMQASERKLTEELTGKYFDQESVKPDIQLVKLGDKDKSGDV